MSRLGKFFAAYFAISFLFLASIQPAFHRLAHSLANTKCGALIVHEDSATTQHLSLREQHAPQSECGFLKIQAHLNQNIGFIILSLSQISFLFVFVESLKKILEDQIQKFDHFSLHFPCGPPSIF